MEPDYKALGWHDFNQPGPSRPVEQIKRDIDNKFKEISKVKSKIKAEENKLERAKKNGISHFGVIEIETKIDRLLMDKARLEREMSQLELDAYSTWIPRARAAREEARQRIEEFHARSREQGRRRSEEAAEARRRKAAKQGGEDEADSLLAD